MDPMDGSQKPRQGSEERLDHGYGVGTPSSMNPAPSNNQSGHQPPQQQIMENVTRLPRPPQNPNSGQGDFRPTDMTSRGPGVQGAPTVAEQWVREYTGMSPNYRGNPGNWDNAPRFPYPPRNQNPGRGNFRPTDMTSRGPGVQRAPTTAEQFLGEYTGMSPNYKGNPGNIHRYSDPNLPDELNCHFWLEGMPLDVEERDIFNAIRGCGRVLALHLNRGDGVKHKTSGAKIQFFTTAAAQLFSKRHLAPGTFIVKGHPVVVKYNWTKLPERGDVPKDHSRCIQVLGPWALVNTDLLRDMGRYIRFQLEAVIVRYSHPTGGAVLEIRFARYDGQAAQAYEFLTRWDLPYRQAGVIVTYFSDPCGYL